MSGLALLRRSSFSRFFFSLSFVSCFPLFRCASVVCVYKFWGWKHSVTYLWFASYQIRHGPQQHRGARRETAKAEKPNGAVWEIIVCILRIVHALDRCRCRCRQPKITYSNFVKYTPAQHRRAQANFAEMEHHVAAEKKYEFLIVNVTR